jgi:MFS family permease
MSIHSSQTAGITPSQLTAYHKNGFIVLRKVFADGEVNSMQRECDRLLIEAAALVDTNNVRCRFMPHHETGDLLFEVFYGTLLGGLFCLPCGWFIDRFGLRSTLTFTVGALAIVVFWMTRLHSSREFAVAVMLTRGFGQSALSVISITMVGEWFTQRTSLAMAVYSLMLSLGFAYAPQLAKPWAESDWRVVWGAMGYCLAAFVPACFIFCRAPRPRNEIASTEAPAISSNCCHLPADPHEGRPCENSVELRDALRTQAFWVFALATSLTGLIGSGLSLFNESVLTSQGFSKDVF